MLITFLIIIAATGAIGLGTQAAHDCNRQGWHDCKPLAPPTTPQPQD